MGTKANRRRTQPPLYLTRVLPWIGSQCQALANCTRLLLLDLVADAGRFRRRSMPSLEQISPVPVEQIIPAHGRVRVRPQSKSSTAWRGLLRSPSCVVAVVERETLCCLSKLKELRQNPPMFTLVCIHVSKCHVGTTPTYSWLNGNARRNDHARVGMWTPSQHADVAGLTSCQSSTE